MNWELPFKRLGWPRMPPAEPCLDDVNPIFYRLIPRIRKVSPTLWECTHPLTRPPGENYNLPSCLSVSPRAAYACWLITCKTIRCPGKAIHYHQWTLSVTM